MRTITATEASRRFSDLLDAIEAGDQVTITRGDRAIAEMRPVRRRTGRDLRDALAGLPALDDGLADDIAQGLEAVAGEAGNPWDDA